MHLAIALLACLFAPSVLSISVLDSRLQRRYNSNHNEWPPDAVVGDIGADSPKNIDISVSHFGKPELPSSKMMMNPWISPLARKFRLMRLSRSSSPLLGEYL